MIEINLVPDVKQELLRAQRVRTTVISIAILAAIGFAAAVVLLSLYVFGAQTLRSALADGSIKDESKKLQDVQDLGKALSLQNQLSSITSIREKTTMDSRLFDVLTTVIPESTTISDISLDAEEKTITLQGETGGYNDLDALKKTILATKFEFREDGDSDIKSVPLATQIGDGDRSYGQDADGKRVLRFSISFAYPEELFSRSSLNGQVVAPTARNATDSKLSIPSSIFTGGGND